MPRHNTLCHSLKKAVTTQPSSQRAENICPQHHLQFQIEECSSAGHISYYYAASALGIEVKFSSLHFCHKVRMLVRHLPRTFYCKVIILAGQTGNLLGLKMANFAKIFKKKDLFFKIIFDMNGVKYFSLHLNMKT